MKVIVAGSRSFADFELMCQKLDRILQHQTDIEIVSGTANGADKLGEQYAKLRGYPVKLFPADWEDMSEPGIAKRRSDGAVYNALAGHKRNEQMAKYADACVIFWDGKSKGSKDMYDLAGLHGLKRRIIEF